jgi:hypothetical protein
MRDKFCTVLEQNCLVGLPTFPKATLQTDSAMAMKMGGKGCCDNRTAYFSLGSITVPNPGPSFRHYALQIGGPDHLLWQVLLAHQYEWTARVLFHESKSFLQNRHLVVPGRGSSSREKVVRGERVDVFCKRRITSHGFSKDALKALI